MGEDQEYGCHIPWEGETIPDGYGILFDPVKHAAYIVAGMRRWEEEQEELKRNPPKIEQAELKDRPAGYYQKGSGV